MFGIRGFRRLQPARSIEKNYYIDANKAYTEDRVLIYKIYVYRIPETATKKQIANYFSKFGKVLQVDLKHDKARSIGDIVLKVAFVHFESADVALRVLEKRNHFLTSQGKRIFIKACDSWNQPSDPSSNDDVITDINTTEAIDTATTAVKAVQTVENVENLNDNEEEISHIFNLTDDCFLNIFQYLRIRERMKLSTLCQRFKNIYEYVERTDYYKLKLNVLTQLTLWEVKEFLILFGKDIRLFEGSDMKTKIHKRIIKLLNIYCPNIQSVSISMTTITPSFLLKMFNSMNNMTQLTLKGCHLYDPHILLLSQFKNLRILALYCNGQLTGKYLCKMSQLRELCLYCCLKVKGSHMIDIASSMTDLEVLDIRGCTHLFENPIFNVWRRKCYLKNLKLFKLTGLSDGTCKFVATLDKLIQLDITNLSAQIDEFDVFIDTKINILQSLLIYDEININIAHMNIIAKLRNLRHLVFMRGHNINDACLKCLCTIKSLEYLGILVCRNVTKVGLLTVLENFPNLRELNIEGCRQIGDDFVTDAIKLVNSENVVKRERPLLIGTRCTGIIETIMTTKSYLDNINNFKITYDMPAPCDNDYFLLMRFSMYDVFNV